MTLFTLRLNILKSQTFYESQRRTVQLIANYCSLKKCHKAEYVQRRVCFVNVQVPCPHFNIYVKLCTSRLCIKMSSFLFVHGCARPRILYLSCEVPFPVWTPDDISGLISVVPWLSREELSKKNCR